MVPNKSNSSGLAAGLLASLLWVLSPPGAAQVYRGAIVNSHGTTAGAALADPSPDLARLSQAMRQHNHRLRLLVQQRETELKAVKSELRQVKDRQPAAVYPLFIATP